MNKRQKVFGATAVLLFLMLVLPALVHRISWEQTSKVYVAAVDVTCLSTLYSEEEMADVLADYKAAGVTTAVIDERRSSYPEELIRIADDTGLFIALAPDVTRGGRADLERLVNEYNVKYIKLQNGSIKPVYYAKNKPHRVYEVLDRYDLTLVLTETITQLGNETPLGYSDYLEAADGKILRAFETYTQTGVDRKDYPLGYYQMYNSAYDRNVRFITVNQLQDAGYTREENALRTQDTIRMFCERMAKDGYVAEGEVDYNEYTPNRRLISAAVGSIGVLMLAFMLELLSRKRIPNLMEVGMGGAALVFAATFILPEFLILLYPTAFSLLAPSFCIAVCAVFVERKRNKLGFMPLLLGSIGIFLAVMTACGGCMAALLSGADYFQNNQVFRGVKASLLVPMVFAFGLIVASLYKKRTLAEYRQLVRDLIRQVRWYHLLILAALGVAGAIYVIRSGNVDEISFTELHMRNLLTEIFMARPRTKEFLVGWPCFMLYVWYAKRERSKLLQYVFALGASILFASTMNTFCHVFTLAETMFMRVVWAFALGAVISVVALVLNALAFKVLDAFLKKENGAV